MARPTEYDLNVVLDKAMEIFWKKGFDAVSMKELVEYTGLNRRTMYTLFKDKEGLFEDALDNYYTKLMSKQFTLLKNNPGKKGLELFFDFFTFDENFKGCLFSNTIREKEFLHEDTYEIPKKFFNKVQIAIEENLTQAKNKDEFNGDPKAMALTIVTFIHGFHVYGKYNSSKKDSQKIIENILNMIN